MDNAELVVGDKSSVGENPLNVNDEIIVRMIKKKKIYDIYYLNDKEKREIIESLGAMCVLVLEVIMRIASSENNQRHVTDEEISKVLGIPVRSAQLKRLALEKSGWYKSYKARQTDGKSSTFYYVGKDSIERRNK